MQFPDWKSLKHWLKLTKPLMWLAICITIIPGLFSTKLNPDFKTVFIALSGTALFAIASFIYNQLWEIKRDALMLRTEKRPLPSGNIQPFQAHSLAALFLTAGSVLLLLLDSYVPVILAAGSFVIYVFLYTIWLKPRSLWCTVAGGFSGAVGPLIGQAAVGGQILDSGWVMFVLLLIWQPPHFWVLAIRCRTEYQNAGIKVLPVVKSLKYTYLQILIYQTLLLICIALACFPLQIFSFEVFGIPALLSGGLVWFMMWRLFRKLEGQQTQRVFQMTILHMIVWHILILVDFIL